MNKTSGRYVEKSLSGIMCQTVEFFRKFVIFGLLCDRFRAILAGWQEKWCALQ